MADRTVASLSVGAIILAAVAAGCAHESAREISRRTVSIQVGKNASGLSNGTDSLWSNWLGETRLPNGNIEIGLRQFRGCRYFFEVDKGSNEFVGWRLEGSEGNCRLPR